MCVCLGGGGGTHTDTWFGSICSSRLELRLVVPHTRDVSTSCTCAHLTCINAWRATLCMYARAAACCSFLHPFTTLQLQAEAEEPAGGCGVSAGGSAAAAVPGRGAGAYKQECVYDCGLPPGCLFVHIVCPPCSPQHILVFVACPPCSPQHIPSPFILKPAHSIPHSLLHTSPTPKTA